MAGSLGFFIQNYLNSSHRKTGFFILSILFYPLALLYKLAMILRRQFYEIGLLKAADFKHPVISIGNITTGGTGKTPFEIFLVGKLREMEIRPLLLSRGYGRKISGSISMTAAEKHDIPDLPDEIKMIAEKFPDIPIAFGKDRILAYYRACEKYDFDVVVLDDGFQHLKIKRDLEILLLDSANPFGSGKMLPSGNLREPKSSLKYADLIVVNQKSAKSPEKSPLADLIESHSPPRGAYRISGIFGLLDGRETAPAEYGSKKCAAISAIGDPRSFLDGLGSLGIRIFKTFLFRDHHDYTEADFRQIENECREGGIEALFTTEKDAVKLQRIRFEKPLVYVIKIQFRLVDGEAVLEKRIRDLAKNKDGF